MTPAGPAGQSLLSRFVGATVAVAMASALLLAGAASLIAWKMWEAGERRDLEQGASVLATKIDSDVGEPDWSLAEDVPNALAESGLTGYRLEVWEGSSLIAANQREQPLGPPSAGSSRPAAWLVTGRKLRGGLELLAAAPRVPVSRALRTFAWSLALAAPLCLGLAFVAGRAVALRAARPLLELSARIQAARPLEPMAPSTCPESVAEVSEIEKAFDGLWARLDAALTRERDFGTNASHELRTPLTRIRLYGERAGALSGAEAARVLDEQRREIDRMERLVDALLILARDAARGAEGETVNLADVVRECTRQAFPEPAGAELVAPDEALVRGDEGLLRISTLNLLDNARKFKQPGARARIDLEESAGLVRLGVTSPGARVGAAERERVFERFYRGSEAGATHEGHGLGLALVRHIARLHGGEAWCVSGPDEDARFELGIPSWRSRGAGNGV